MRIIYNNLIPVGNFVAMMLFGMIFARKKYEPLDAYTINHEAIHRAQAKDCGCYLLYYLRYLIYWVEFGYYENPLEKEAYLNERNLQYLETRKPFVWR